MNCHDCLYSHTGPRLNSRRWFLKECGFGLGKIALASLLTDAFASQARAAGTATTDTLKPESPHFPGKAKRVIHLFMAGAPSQPGFFDHKPEMAKLEGKPLPPPLIGGQRFRFLCTGAPV